MEAPKELERHGNLPHPSEKKKALITGVTGQIGSYLAELLLEKGYEVYGIIRRTSHVESARARIDHIEDLNLIYGDLGDASVIAKIISEVEPDEIYNLGAQSHVWISFQTPEHTSDVNALGALRICEAARNLKKKVKIYQASTSELYGGIYNYPVNEETPFHPRSPYGIAKLYAYWTIKHYREAYNMFCANGIIFNTESPRRGENFVTRKITKGIAEIMSGKRDKITLGNLNAKRDWNHAKDSAEAMWRIMQAEEASDFVIASGESRSIRDFVEEAFSRVGVEIEWKGKNLEEVGIDKKTGKVYVSVDPYYFRPTDVNVLIGDASKARNQLGWEPKLKFKDIVDEMMEYDMNKVKKNGRPPS
jgi:GDPmannose 4,6-dehydratase